MTGPRKPSESGIRRAVAAPVQPVPQSSAATAPALAAAPPVAARRPAPARQRPVRFTLDLSPELHSYLGDFAAGADADKSDVMRELLRQMRTDRELAGRVTAEIHRRREALREALRQAQE
jgi:hypothetical protein